MPLPTIPNTIRVAFEWTPPAGLRKCVNVMHFTILGQTIDDVWDNLETHVTATMWYGSRSTASITKLTLTHLGNNDLSVEHITSGGAKWAGATTTGDITPQVAQLVSLRTNRRGRSWRGRVYIPYTSESNIAGGVYDSSIRAAQQTGWNTFITNMSASSTPLVVASYKEEDVSEVVAAVVRGFPGTQRRRQQRA